MGHKSPLSLKFPTVILCNATNTGIKSNVLTEYCCMLSYSKKQQTHSPVESSKKIDCLFTTEVSLLTTEINFSIVLTVLHPVGP